MDDIFLFKIGPFLHFFLPYSYNFLVPREKQKLVVVLLIPKFAASHIAMSRIFSTSINGIVSI